MSLSSWNMSLCITFLAHVLDCDFPKENFSYIFSPLAKQKSFQILSMDYFHNINVVNTQYEKILISAVHMAHSAMKMSLFQSSLPLWLLAYLREFLRKTHFLVFCLSIYCLKSLFQVIRNDWRNLFWQSAQNFRPEKTFCRRWVVNSWRNVVSWLLQ